MRQHLRVCSVIVGGFLVGSVLLVATGPGAVAQDVAQDEIPPAATQPAAPQQAAPQQAAPEKPATENAGQEELDAAIDAKLGARGLADLDRVLAHCQRALELGLDDESRKFADSLYTGTLVDRAAMLVEVIYRAREPDPQWPRMRAFAMRDLEEIVTRDPDLGQAHLMIARLESLPRGNPERARSAAERALELLGDDRLQKARAHLVLAAVADDPEQQTVHLDAAVELAPRDVDIRRTRGMQMLVQDRFDQACEDLEAAIATDPEDATLHQALGMACMMDNRMDAARDAFDRAVELAPDAAGPYLQRARLEAVAGNNAEALDDIEHALDLNPGDIQALLLRARVHQQAGDDDAAEQDVEDVLRRDVRNAQALELRGLMAAERGDYRAAVDDFRRLVATQPDDAVLLSQLGMLYLAAKQPRKAIDRFTRALEIDEQHFPSLRGRSDARISIGEHEAAVADLEKALDLRPDDSGVLNNLAWVLATSPDEKLRDGPRAVELATKACEVTDWKQAHIISTLAAGHAEQGDFEAAKKFSRQAVDAQSEADEVEAQLREELASYEQEKPWRELQELEDVPFAGEEPALPALMEEAARPRRPFDDDE